MRFARPDEIKLQIREVKAESVNGRLRWKTTVSFKGIEKISPWDREIWDPFKEKWKHDRIKEYLNETLNKPEKISDDRSRSILRSLVEYRTKIFKGLGLNGRLHLFSGKKVSIEIVQNEDEGKSASYSTRPFHSIYWEILEDLSTWISPEDKETPGPISVTVRRCVPVIKPKQRQPREKQTVRNKKSEGFNILLVVARMSVHESVDQDGFNPTSVLRAILGAQEDLEFYRAQKRIHLEVVRPGCYEELHLHLTRSHKAGKFFQIVHFDMHGNVNSDIGAHLIFNRFDSSSRKLIESEVSAGKIAQLLREYKIDCAVLSSCKTAVADAGFDANLSWSFLQEGMASVLAISHNIPDTMSQLFFSSFYHEIFVNREEFADAAALARGELRKHPQRFSYLQDDWTCMQDWFIPQVYSNGAPWYINHHPSRRNPFRFWLASPDTHLILSMIVLLGSFLIDLPDLSILAFLVKFYMHTDKQSNLMLKRGLFRTGCACLSALYLRRRWRKMQSAKRLEGIQKDRKNILRIEGDLRHSHKVFIHTNNDADNSAQSLIEVLSDIWCRTHWVQHRMMVNAEWFIQPFNLDDIVWANWRYIFTSFYNSLQLSLNSIPAGLAHWCDGEQGAHTVIVIANYQILFPKEQQEEYHLIAQQRFLEWIDRYLGPTSEKTSKGKKAPFYLIFIGESLPDPTQHFLPSIVDPELDWNGFIITDYKNPDHSSHGHNAPQGP